MLVAGIAAFAYYLLSNTLHNMEQRGITTGFGFLSNEAGFGILQSLIPYDETYTYGRTFVVGLLNTLLVAALGIFFATFIGFFVGVARLSHNWLVAKLATVYIETFRNIPLLLQIMFWYFAVLRPLPLPRPPIPRPRPPTRSPRCTPTRPRRRVARSRLRSRQTPSTRRRSGSPPAWPWRLLTATRTPGSSKS